MREKKVRGLRRRFRQFQQWSETVNPLERTPGAEWQYAHARASTGPWVGLSYASNPPTGFQREAIRGLLRTHGQWQAELADSPEPYYLAVWFYELTFRDTRLMAAFGERKALYEEWDAQPVDPQPPLPELLSRVPGAEQLHWQAYDHVVPAFWASDYSPASLARILRRYDYYTVEQPDGDTLYYVYRGLQWVGR